MDRGRWPERSRGDPPPQCRTSDLRRVLRPLTQHDNTQSKGAIVSISPQTSPDFAFKAVKHPTPEPVLDIGPLEQLVGPDGKRKWEGAGFNTIWRPHPLAEGQDRFLE